MRKRSRSNANGLGVAKASPGSMIVNDMSSCGPNIKEGKYGCGRFGPGLARTLRVIYVCTNGRLRRRETCKRGSKNDMCVRNSRRKGKAFYPFEAADQLVCVKTKDALKP